MKSTVVIFNSKEYHMIFFFHDSRKSRKRISENNCFNNSMRFFSVKRLHIVLLHSLNFSLYSIRHDCYDLSFAHHRAYLFVFAALSRNRPPEK